jgi:hypothetical protein
MSFLRPAAASSSGTLRTALATRSTRAFSSTPAAAAGARRVDLGKFDLDTMEQYQFDDATSLGHLRLLQIDGIRALVAKMSADAKALNGWYIRGVDGGEEGGRRQGAGDGMLR